MTFNQNVLPAFLADYASTILVFYITIVYLAFTVLRASLVPNCNDLYIEEAPYTQDLLMVCTAIFIYRFKGKLKEEEELYYMLIDIMRSPEMIKSLTGSSLKKKLE